MGSLLPSGLLAAVGVLVSTAESVVEEDSLGEAGGDVADGAGGAAVAVGLLSKKKRRSVKDAGGIGQRHRRRQMLEERRTAQLTQILTQRSSLVLVKL